MGREPRSLAEENRAQHDWQQERLLEFVEALTELDFVAARDRLDRFEAHLKDHMATEDAHSIPALAPFLEDGSKTIKQIEGDHIILTRNLARARASLDEVEAAGNVRRALVRELDTFLLIRRVLEHHTMREMRDLYPILDDGLPEDARITILNALQNSHKKHNS